LFGLLGESADALEELLQGILRIILANWTYNAIQDFLRGSQPNSFTLAIPREINYGSRCHHSAAI
jgi:hypothetical protein